MIRIIGLLSIAIALLYSAKACAQRITVLTEHLPPFQLVEPGSIGGFATQIVTKVFEHAKVDYDLSHHQWSDAYQYTLKTPNTCLYSTIKTPERAPLFSWVGKITDLSTALYAKTNSDIQLTSLEDAKQYTIAVMKEDFFHQHLLSLGFVENENLYVSETYRTLTELLELPTRHIDLVIINAGHLPYRISQSQSLSDLKLVLEVEELHPDMYLACNLETDAATLTSLHDSMEVLYQQGEFERIEREWHTRQQLDN